MTALAGLNGAHLVGSLTLTAILMVLVVLPFWSRRVTRRWEREQDDGA